MAEITSVLALLKLHSASNSNHDIVNSIQPRATPTFLELPREIRQRIYFHLMTIGKLSPDAAYSLERLPPLMLACKTIYCEAFGLLRHDFIKVDIKDTMMPFLRRAKDHPKPRLYTSEKATSRCHTAPPFTELNLLRLRKVAFCIDYEGRWLQSHGRGILRNLAGVAEILDKSDTVRHVRLLIKQEDYCYVSTGLDIRRALVQIVRVAAKAGILVRAEHDPSHPESGTDFEKSLPLERLADYINKTAVRFRCHDDSGEDLIAPFTPQERWEDVVDAASWSSSSSSSSSTNPSSPSPWYSDTSSSSSSSSSGPASPTWSSLSIDNPVHTTPTTAPTHHHDFDLFPYPPGPTTHHLLPECRTCYALFPTTPHLKSHLRLHPTHARPYTAKPLNNLQIPFHRERICWTCGRGFLTETRLKAHLQGEKGKGKGKGHRRFGLVPRWREDNDYYARRWRRWFETHGWC